MKSFLMVTRSSGILHFSVQIYYGMEGFDIPAPMEAVMKSFDDFFVVIQNKLLKKQSRR